MVLIMVQLYVYGYDLDICMLFSCVSGLQDYVNILLIWFKCKEYWLFVYFFGDGLMYMLGIYVVLLDGWYVWEYVLWDGNVDLVVLVRVVVVYVFLDV